MMPSNVDQVDRTPMESQRLVASYLLQKWGLVAVDITTSVSTILQVIFVGSQVIVLDGSVDQTCILYNKLQEAYHSRMQTRKVVC